MSKISVYNSKGKEVGSISIGKEFGSAKVNTGVLYQAVNNYLAARHRGTHKTKNRREVSGGGKKPWRQKGTGRARVGSSRNPIWRGGGISFGPVVRSYAYSIPKKVKRLALLEAIKSKLQAEELVVFDDISLDKPKTKKMASIAKALRLGENCILVMDKIEGNIRLAARNIEGFSVKNCAELNALDVLRHEKLAISEKSLKNLMERHKDVFAPSAKA